ncbi:ECF RNA polymerase sigma factor SigW [compost metagenome]
MLSQELRRTVQAAADMLDDKLKIPLYLYYTVEMTIDEIASVLKIPTGTVKSRLFQARRAMKKILEEVEFP